MKPTLNEITLAGALTMAPPGVALATSQDDLRNVAGHNHPALMQKYIIQGVDPDLKIRDGTPLLVDALKEKSIEVAEALIRARSIDPERTNAAGESTLIVAAYQGLLSIMKLMVEMYDVEINKADWIALHYATINGYDDIIKCLPDHTAYIDTESPNATTPLMVTTMGGHIMTVKLLLGKGANTNLRNQQKMDVIDFTKRYRQDEAAAELESRRYKLTKQSGKLTSMPAPAAAVSPPVKTAAPDMPTPMLPAKRDAGASNLAGRDTISTSTNILFDSSR